MKYFLNLLIDTSELQNSFEEVQSYWMQELKHQCFGDGGLQVQFVVIHIGLKVGLQLSFISAVFGWQ